MPWGGGRDAAERDAVRAAERLGLAEILKRRQRGGQITGLVGQPAAAGLAEFSAAAIGAGSAGPHHIVAGIEGLCDRDHAAIGGEEGGDDRDDTIASLPGAGAGIRDA